MAEKHGLTSAKFYCLKDGKMELIDIQDVCTIEFQVERSEQSSKTIGNEALEIIFEFQMEPKKWQQFMRALYPPVIWQAIWNYLQRCRN